MKASALLTAKRALIVFVKSPIPGEVKTRLIPHLTSEEAAFLYKCFVADTMKTAAHMAASSRIQVAYQPHSRAMDLSWLGLRSTPETFRQEGKSLGERLTHAFGVAFGHGSSQVVIIGSDSPTLPHRYLEQAFQALNDSDVVLGPSIDGGYYLIGLSRPCTKLFEDLTWSSDQVFEGTKRNAETLGYRLRLLPKHYDIDTFEDLQMLHTELAKDAEQAPVTWKFLSTLAKKNPGFSAERR